METNNLTHYLNEGVRNIMSAGVRNFFGNPKETAFLLKMKKIFEKSEYKRKQIGEEEGIQIPPFLICSISNTCNLSCKGCYAIKNGIARNVAPTENNDKDESVLTAEDWVHIFKEAASIGINFALLAGGEPLTRPDLLNAISEVKDMIFPVFTNGTLLGPSYIRFFDRHRNMIPIISIEGFERGTDQRRGKGVFNKACDAMKELFGKKLLFGTSVTVTTENMDFLTSEEFLSKIQDWGCRLIFFIEYVPLEGNTLNLALEEQQAENLNKRIEDIRERFPGIIFLSFPGDEKFLGGCLASGRGFFHINPYGKAEPCPFSPFSDSNVKEFGLLETIRSPLFRNSVTLKAMNGHIPEGAPSLSIGMKLKE